MLLHQDAELRQVQKKEHGRCSYNCTDQQNPCASQMHALPHSLSTITRVTSISRPGKAAGPTLPGEKSRQLRSYTPHPPPPPSDRGPADAAPLQKSHPVTPSSVCSLP